MEYGQRDREYFDAAIEIIRRLRALVYETADERMGPHAQFDAGTLAAAEMIVRAAVPDDYQPLKEYDEAEMARRLMDVLRPGSKNTEG